MKESSEGKRRVAGVSLLGNPTASFPASPELARLETFANPDPARNYEIEIACGEFTSLCPVTGQPDFAQLELRYVPDARCLETKALKLYLASYRNVHAFNEAVVNRIFKDLVAACRPRWLRLQGRFVPRGGLALTVTAEHPPIAVPARGGRRSRRP